MGSGPTEHYSCRKSSQWMECRRKQGGEALFILFFYRTAFDYCDTECQIKRPRARGSVSGLFQKQHYASFSLFIRAVPSPAAAASLPHTERLLVFSPNFPKFFSLLRRGSRVRVIAHRLASTRASATTLAKANFSKGKTLALSKNLQLLQFLMETTVQAPCDVRRSGYITATVCLMQYFPFLISYPYFSGLLGSMHAAAGFKRTSVALM